MKRIILTGTLAAGLLMPIMPVMAQSNDIKEDKQELRQDIRDLKADLPHFAHFTGQITAINGTTLTVSKDGKTYAVNTDSNTRLRRHFGAQSSLSEFSVNDTVIIWGKYTDDTKTTVLARLIRDASIMKRHGTFNGTVTSKSGNSFVLQSNHRGNQTVNFDGSTKIVNKQGQTISADQITTGDKVRVRGLWDKALSTISQVLHIKDFSK